MEQDDGARKRRGKGTGMKGWKGGKGRATREGACGEQERETEKKEGEKREHGRREGRGGKEEGRKGKQDEEAARPPGLSERRRPRLRGNE